MDYETIEVDKPVECSGSGCYCDCKPDISWDCGETMEIELPITGEFTLDNEIEVTPSDFLKGSNTKYVKMVLKDSLGNVIDTQMVKGNSGEIIFDDETGVATAYYVVDSELSNKIRAGVYYLYVYLINILPKNGKIPEKTLLNLMVSGPDGIEVLIF